MAIDISYDSTSKSLFIKDNGLLIHAISGTIDVVGLKAPLAISGATNASPCVITSEAHNLSAAYDGLEITVKGVQGCTAANGNFYAKFTGYTSTTLALYQDAALSVPVDATLAGTFVAGGATLVYAGLHPALGRDAIQITNTNMTTGIAPQFVRIMISDIATINGATPSATDIVSITQSIMSLIPALQVTLTGGGPVTGGINTYSMLVPSTTPVGIVVKGSPGRVNTLSAFNVGSAYAFVRLYDKATAPANTDVPFFRGAIPGNNNVGAGFVQTRVLGVYVQYGLGMRVTALIPDNDATAVPSNTITVNVDYQ